MGFKPPNFSGLNHPVSQNKSQCCRERSHLLRGEHRQTQLPAPNPKPFQCLVPFPLPHGGRTSDPQNRPAEQLQPQPWKDSRSLGLICLPALKLIPCTLCLTAPYLACQRSGEAQPLCPLPGPSQAQSSGYCMLFRAGDEWASIYRTPDSVPNARTKATIDTSVWLQRNSPSAFKNRSSKGLNRGTNTNTKTNVSLHLKVPHAHGICWCNVEQDKFF